MCYNSPCFSRESPSPASAHPPGPALSLFSALFCTRPQRFAFLFNHLRTLCVFTRGVTKSVPPIPQVLLQPPPFLVRISLFPCLLTSSPLAAKLFPTPPKEPPCLKPRKLPNSRIRKPPRVPNPTPWARSTSPPTATTARRPPARSSISPSARTPCPPT